MFQTITIYIFLIYSIVLCVIVLHASISSFLTYNYTVKSIHVDLYRDAHFISSIIFYRMNRQQLVYSSSY